MARRIKRNLSRAASCNGSKRRILGGTAKIDAGVVIIGINHRGAPHQIGKNVDLALGAAKFPTLGVVPVRGQRGLADQIAQPGRDRKRGTQRGHGRRAVGHRPHLP